MVHYTPKAQRRSPLYNVQYLRAVVCAIPLLSLPILLIQFMGPQVELPGTRTRPLPTAEEQRLFEAFAWGCTAILLLIRFRLPRDAAAWKRHAAIYLAWILSVFTYFLLFMYAGDGGGWGWLWYGVGLIVFAVTQVSIGRFGYDLSPYEE